MGSGDLCAGDPQQVVCVVQSLCYLHLVPQWEVVTCVLEILSKLFVLFNLDKLNSETFLHSVLCYLHPQWEVVTCVLEILHKLLRDHEVTEDDFREEVLELPNSSTVAASKKPGFSLLMHMLNDSPLFKMVSVAFLLVFNV